MDIPKNIRHNVECLESGSVFFECKEGPFVPHEEEGILEMKSENEERKVEINPERCLGFLLVCVSAAEATESVGRINEPHVLV